MLLVLGLPTVFGDAVFFLSAAVLFGSVSTLDGLRCPPSRKCSCEYMVKLKKARAQFFAWSSRSPRDGRSRPDAGIRRARGKHGQQQSDASTSSISRFFFSFFPWPTTLWRCLLLGMLLKLGVVNTYATLGVLGVAFDACCSALIASAKENKRFARLLPPVACLGVRMLSHAVHMLCLCCAFVMRLCCAFVMRHAISVPRSEP